MMGRETRTPARVRLGGGMTGYWNYLGVQTTTKQWYVGGSPRGAAHAERNNARCRSALVIYRLAVLLARAKRPSSLLYTYLHRGASERFVEIGRAKNGMHAPVWSASLPLGRLSRVRDYFYRENTARLLPYLLYLQTIGRQFRLESLIRHSTLSFYPSDLRNVNSPSWRENFYVSASKSWQKRAPTQTIKYIYRANLLIKLYKRNIY